MTNQTIVAALTVLVVVLTGATARVSAKEQAHAKEPAHGKEQAHGKETKRSADEQKPLAERAKPRNGNPPKPGEHEKTGATGGRDAHQSPAKSVKAGDHDTGSAAKHGSPGDRDDHGSSANRRERSGHDEPQPRTRARLLDTSTADDHDDRKASAAPARRVRPASGEDLEAITEQIKHKIVELPRAQRQPVARTGGAAVAPARPNVKAKLVWRPALSWPPALDTGDDRFADVSGTVQLTWASESRCTPDFAEPELPSSTWSTLAGLAPSRCCGLFQTK